MLEQRILTFIDRYSEESKIPQIESITIDYQELWEGQRCYFCKNKKKRRKRKYSWQEISTCIIMEETNLIE